jgi:hypothetical protein
MLPAAVEGRRKRKDHQIDDRKALLALALVASVGQLPAQTNISISPQGVMIYPTVPKQRPDSA